MSAIASTTQPFTKQEILAGLAQLPIGLVNLLVATCLREGEASLQRTPVAAVPDPLTSAALPGASPTERLLPIQNGRLLPNFAGDVGAVIPLLEEVRAKFPAFFYRIACERLTVAGEARNGFRIETAEPRHPAQPEMLQIRANFNGTELPIIASFAALEYLLDRPDSLTRASFHLSRPAQEPAGAPVTLQ